MEVIFFTVMTIFSVIGLASVVRWLSGRLLSEDKNQQLIFVIPCGGHREDLEYAVKSTYSHMTEQCRYQNCHVILADCGMDEETRAVCRMLAREHDFVGLCDCAELGTFVAENFHCKSMDFVI